LRSIQDGEEGVERPLIDRYAAVIDGKSHRLQFAPERMAASSRRAHGCTQNVTISTCRGAPAAPPSGSGSSSARAEDQGSGPEKCREQAAGALIQVNDPSRVAVFIVPNDSVFETRMTWTGRAIQPTDSTTQRQSCCTGSPSGLSLRFGSWARPPTLRRAVRFARVYGPSTWFSVSRRPLSC